MYPTVKGRKRTSNLKQHSVKSESFCLDKEPKSGIE
jgi:hypothetical protein